MNIQNRTNTTTFSSDQLILIVDHYRIGQRIALMQLQYFGLTAHVVYSCRQAIQALKKDHYALVLIGWGLPGCDGTSCIKFVRRVNARRRTYTSIVAVTSHSVLADKSRCLALGMDDLLSKPITMSDMQAVLTRHLKKAA